MTENKWFNMLAGNSEQAPKSEKPEDTIPEYLRRPEEVNPDYDPNVDYQQFKKQMGRIHNQLQSVMPEAVYGTAAQEVMRTTPNEAYSNPFDWSLEKAIEQTSARAEQQEVQKKAIDKANEYLPEEASFGERLKRWTEGFSSPTIGVAGTSITPSKETHSYREALAGTTWDIVSSLPTDEGGKVLVNGLAYDKNKLSVSLMPYVEAAIEPVLMRDKGYWDVFAQKRGFGSYTSMLDFYDAKVDELASAIKPLDLTSSVSATNPNPNVQSGAMFAQAMSREASGAKAVRDARDKLNAMRDGTFWNGVFEGGDAFNALTLGLSGLYSEIELNKTLNKVYDGEALTEREQAIFDIYSTTKELESLDNYLGKSWIRDVGNAIGVTAEMAPQFIPAMGVAGSLANLSKVGIKTGYGLVRRAMRQGITNGVIEIGKQTARVGYNVGKNLFMANVGGAVGAIMQPATYSNFIQKRNEQFSMQNGRLVYTPTEEWKDFVNALIEQTNEVSSEVLGGAVSDILGLSFKGFGKMLGIDKAVNSVSSSMGLGASYGKLFGIKKSDAFKAFERSLSYAGDPFSEALSEIWGDVSSNFMKMLVSGDADWSQFNDPRYWTTNLAVAAIYGGAMQMAHEASRIPDYMTIANLGKVKHETVRTIESKVLADALRMMGVDKDINASAQRLASIDWGSQNPMDRAKAADYIRAEAIQQVMLGVSEENTHLTQFARDAQAISASVYTGKDGNAVSDKVIEAELEDGTMVNVVSGDMTDMDAIIMVRNSEGVVEPIARQKIKIVAMYDVASKVEQRFKDLFGQQQISQKIAEIEQKYDELVGPTKEDVAQMMEELSIAEPQEGETITLVDGRKALFLGWNEDMTLNVEAQSADGTYELLVVPFHKILSSASHIAEAQIASLAEKTLDVAKEELVNEEVETTTAETIEEGVIVDTPQGKARVVQMGDESIIVDHNLNSNGRAEDMETAEYALNEVGLPTSLETEPVAVEQQDSEQAQVEAAKNVEVAQNAVAGIKAVPMNEDGTINYDAIDDPIVFAQQYKNEVGNVEQAIADVTETRNAAEVKAQEVADKSKKLTSMNERNASRKEVEALKQRVAFYDAVLKELTPKEEKTVGLVENEFTRDINEDVLATIEEFAQRFGVLVELVEAATDGNGNVVNGYIKDGKVYLTADGKLRTRSLSFLVGHEFTHRMKDLSPEQFEAYKQSVRAFVGEEKWAKLILNMQSRYVFNNMSKQAEDTALMEEEVASDFMGTMVESNDVFNSYLYSLNTGTGLLAAIKRVLRAIGELFTGKEEKRVDEMLNQVNALIAAAEKANTEGETPNDGKAKMSIIGEQDGMKYSVSSAPIFYSNAQYAVQNIKQEKATPEQWLKMIEKSGGLKAGEDKWLGLSDWLKASDKKTLTKDEVLQYIAENDIQIEEVKYDENANIKLEGKYLPSIQDEYEDIKKDLVENKKIKYVEDLSYYAWQEMINRYGRDFTRAFDLNEDGEIEIANYGKALDIAKLGVDIDSTRLDYTTRGLNNKREIALVVPTIEPYNQSDEVHFGDAGDGRAVAWVRFGETTDADGKRVLVIDEIQSKRHQDGREKGYRDVEAEKREKAERERELTEVVLPRLGELNQLYNEKYGVGKWRDTEYDRQWRPRRVYRFLTPEEQAEHESLSIRATELQTTMPRRSGIPSAPFEKNWAELAFKRMLRYAAENGYDYVAWTTGGQQADRYDLSKKVDRIIYKANDNGTYQVSAMVAGRGHKLGDEIPQQELSNYVGKELADRIINSEGYKTSVSVPWPDSPYEFEKTKVEEWNTLSGGDLKVGGEGMKAFYDQMLPSFVKKYTKKWGAEVGEVTMPDLEENNTMHAVNVTDSMRESVMQGQPKFSLAGTEVGFILENYDDIQDIATAVEAVVKRYPKDSVMLANVLSDYRQNVDDDEFIQGLRTFAKYFGDKQERDHSEDKATIEETFGGIWIEDTKEFAKFVSAVNTYPTDENGEGIAKTSDYFYLYYRGIDEQIIPFVSVYLNKDESQNIANELINAWNNGEKGKVREYIDGAYEVTRDVNVQGNNLDGTDKELSATRGNDILGSELSQLGRYYYTPELYSKVKRADSGSRGQGKVNYSLITPEMDATYLDAVERGDMETAQRMVMEAAKLAMPNTKVVDENGNPKVVYHQTNHSVYINRETGQNWDELDWRERMEWDERDDWDDYWEERDFNTFSRVNARTTQELDGFFFAPEYDEHHEYGDRTIEAFLNIENPASFGDYNIDSSKTNAGRDERIRLQNEGYDGVINEEDGSIWEYIAFNPNQIKSADPVTYDDNGNVIPLSERFNPKKEDIRYSLIGEIGAANIEEYGRYGSPMLALEMARELEAQGKSVKDIRLATNWERGKDGKWRYEIMDGKYNHPKDDDITKKRYPLADILDNADLYKAYPYLKDMEVVYDPTLKYYGLYNGKSIKINSLRTEEQIASTLMHEVQHAIQVTEAFAISETPNYSIAETLDKEVDNLVKEFKDTPNANILRKGYLLYKIVKNAINSAKGANKADDAYHKLAGEVEARNVQKRMSMTPEQRLRTLLSATEDVARKDQGIIYQEAMDGVERAEILSKANAKQKIPNANIENDLYTFDDTRYSLRDDIDARIAKKRPDILPEERMEVVEYIMSRGDAKTSKVFAHYFVNGAIRLNEDDDKVMQAIETAKRAKVDPMSFKSPDEVLDVHAQFKPKAKPIDPDKVPTLSDKRDYGNGIVTYLVDESQESRENMREIINSHYGKNANPWCLLATDADGKLSVPSALAWYTVYNQTPKRVAFYNGKLIAFSASKNSNIVWVDRLDKSYTGIPILQRIGDGRNGTRLFDEKSGQFIEGYHNIYKGNKRDGIYQEWYTLEQEKVKASYEKGKLNGPYIEFYEDGGFKIKATYKDAKADGTYEEYYRNGTVYKIATYKDVKLNGLYEEYYEDGTSKIKTFYEDGKLNGSYEEFYEDGTPKIKTIYNDDFVKGGYTEYYRDGAIYIKASYKDGNRDGLYEEYFENGTLSERGTYKDGEIDGLYEAYFENGSLKAKGIFKDGEVDGLYEAYFENGTPRRMERVDGDIKSTELWYPNGQMSTKERVDKDENGDTIAITVTWYDDGTKKSVSSKKNGKPNGEIVNWHPNGNIQYRAIYEDGLLNGRIESYDENGSLNYTEEYKKGRKHGESIRYYPSGDIQSVEEYEGNQRNGVSIVYTENGAIEDVRTYKDGVETNEPLFSVRDMPFFEDNGDVIIFDDLAEEDARERKPLVTEDTLRSYIDGRHYAATQRIRKEADDMKQIARLRLQEEHRKRSDGIISQRSNVGKVSYILGDIPRGSLSFYDQALVMIAEGEVSIMWGTDKNGRKGLAAELGLKDGEKKDYRQITKGATQSFESFVHNWWESLGGYEMGIDTQDLRNALIEALSETGKAHVAINILRQKYDAPQQEYDNAIADIEAHVDRELQMEDTRYKEEIAEFEGGTNKQQLTRYYEQNAIFNDDISAIRYTIRDLEKKLERATREVASARQRNKEYTKKQLDAQFERNKDYTKKVVTELRENIEAAKATIKEAISNSPALKFYGREVQSVVASLGDVRSSKSLEAVLGRVENMLLNIRIREERNNMQRLLNMRLPNGQLVEEWVGNQMREGRMTAAEGHIIISDMFRGVNSKGVKVAKKVDNHVQEVMTFLRNELVLPIAKKRVRITLESGEERRVFDPEKELTEPTKALRAANDMAIKIIEEKAAEGGRDYSTSEKVELEARDLFNLYLDVVEYKYALHENKERIETYKERIRNLKAGIEDLKAQNKPVDDIIVANIEAARNILSKIYANNVEHKRNYEKSIQTFNKVVGDLLAKGRDALKTFRIGKEEHKAKIITLALKAIGGKDAKSNPQAPTSMEKVAAFMREWINDPYWTFETCCREIDRFAPNGEGEFFKYFMGGAQDAANKLILSHVAHMERVGDKIQKLWRKHRNKTPYKAYEAVMTEADTHVVGSITYMTKWDAENKVAHNPETTELRISNAMYIIAMWRQAQYQETMARYGITQEKIDAIIESIRRIDPRYIDFMDFVNDTFLPATRLEYDEVHKKMFGTSMAEIKNYFPAEVIRKYEEVDVSKTADGALPSTVTRSIISRRPHGNLPKFTLNYFGMLLSHIQDMDHWASYGQLIEDINTVLSNVEFKKRLNEYMSGTNNDRTGAGSLYHIFRTRCAIMTGAYQSKRMKQDWVKLLTRGFASSNISWRLSTALKQLSASPLFAAYSVNPKCLAIWAKNFVIGAATIRKTIAWAVENSPSFRERWAMKYSGNEKLMQTSRDIRTGIDPTIASRSAIVKAGKNTLDIVEKIAVEWGMAPNAAIDAWVCATGMKTIYEFEISKATGGKREATEQEKNATMRKVEIFMNTTQQSAESAYISEIQAQGSWLTMYMNASYAFHRLRIRGAQELWKGLTNKEYRRNVIDKYGKEALSDANKKATARLIQGIIGDLNFWMISAAGKSLWGLINEVIYGADDDEDEDEPMTAMEKIWSVARVPLSMAFNGYVGGNLLGSAIMGFEVDYNAPMNSLFEDIKKVFDFKEDDEDNVTDLTYNIWAGCSLVAKYGLGVDLDTYLNIVRGFGEINSVEGIMKIFNEPRSAIKLIAGRRRKGETMKEHVDRLIHLELVIDNVTYEDLVDEEDNYIGEGKISRMHYLSAKQVRGFMKEYRERQLRKVRSREEFANANNIDERYNIVCERMGWNPEKTPTNDKVDKSGDYTLEQNRKNLWTFPEGLTEKEYYKLKEIAAEAAAKCRERNKFIGSDESLKSLLEEEYNLKQNVIDVYNEL